MMIAARRLKVQEIVEAADISHGSMVLIMNVHLGKNKLCTRWVPRSLTSKNCLVLFRQLFWMLRVLSRLHKCVVAIGKFKFSDLGNELILRSPYYPDLAPSDYFLLPKAQVKRTPIWTTIWRKSKLDRRWTKCTMHKEKCVKKIYLCLFDIQSCANFHN